MDRKPFGWGDDPLTKYLDTARENQFATFANYRSEVIDLTTIDGMFRKLVDDPVNATPLLPIGFLQRSHSAYLAACGATMAGQLYEVQALLRICLEQAGYAYYVGGDQERWERWMGRHEPRSRSQQEKWRDEFTHGKVTGHLKSTDAALGAIYKKLYDQAIDYGAHPNERGTSLSSATEDMDDGGKRFLTIYLHQNGLFMDFSLRMTAQVGLCVLRIARLIYPTRMQAVGITHQLEDMCKRF